MGKWGTERLSNLTSLGWDPNPGSRAPKSKLVNYYVIVFSFISSFKTFCLLEFQVVDSISNIFQCAHFLNDGSSHWTTLFFQSFSITNNKINVVSLPQVSTILFCPGINHLLPTDENYTDFCDFFNPFLFLLSCIRKGKICFQSFCI